MPVIGIPLRELTSRLGRELERPELLRLLERIGCDVEGYEVLNRARCAACGLVMEMVGKEEAPPRCDRCDADLRAAGALEEMAGLPVVRMELLAARPDLFDPGGLGRALRGVLGIETGLPSYAVAPPVLRLRVDDSVRRPRSSRPYIACAVMEHVRLDDDRMKIVMKLQENLHWALGRDRKHASIGVYDLDSLGLESSGRGGDRGFDLEYTTEDPLDYAFVPLGSGGTGPADRRSLRRILEEHPKGTAYAHLLAGFDRYPILRTRGGLVLSMPPIINSEQTKVHTGSRRLFIDVTGTGRRIVHRTLNILVTSLLELDPSFRLSAVRIENGTAEADPQRGSDEETTPDLRPQEASIEVARAAALLGLPLTSASLRELLLRMRHGVEEVHENRTGRGSVDAAAAAGRGTSDGTAPIDTLRVRVPAYRNDILHERDLMEDAAIAYGYDEIPKTLVTSQTLGLEDPLERRSEETRDVMVGLGFLEVMSLVLTSPEQSDRLLRRADHPATSLVENPISSEQVQLRTSLIPGLLTMFARNRHNPLPQEIFEVGDVTFLDREAETGARERRHLAFAVISPKASFADLRALTEAVVRELAWPLRLQAAAEAFLLEGRAARVLSPEGTDAGIMGEVHPAVLEALGLQNPVIVCELALPDEQGAQPYLSLP